MVFILVAVLSHTLSFTSSKLAAQSGAGVEIYLNVWYIAALSSHALRALVWQQALKRYPLSIAYPFMSAVFLIIPAVSFFVFDETISVGQIAGAVLIATGTVLLNRTVKSNDEATVEEGMR